MGKGVEKGINDLETWCNINDHKELLDEWNYEKNNPLTPSNICMGSGKKVWWKCSKGHQFEQSPNSRTNNMTGCPYCTNQKILIGYNDLSTRNPDLAKEWDYKKNGNLTPSDVGSKTNKKVWWKCSKGHQWLASISSRTKQNPTGCPYCSGRYAIQGVTDLMTTNPKLCEEWDYKKNAGLKDGQGRDISTPDKISSNSSKKVWWKCKFGHKYQSPINTRNKGIGCPYCSGRYVIQGVTDLMTTNPDLCKEWNYEKNMGKKNKQGKDISTPDKISSNSNQKVWWICEYNHEWKTSVSNRTNGRNCPFCSNSGSSLPEQGIAFYLEKVCKIEQRIRINNMEIDVYLPEYKIAIEYDGIYYHIGREKQEAEKTSKLLNSNIYLIRIKESNVNNIENGNVIKYDGHGINSNYVWALNSLFKLLYKKTNNSLFNSIQIDLKSDALNIRERFNLFKKKNSLAYCYPTLNLEWDTVKNGKLKPEMFFSGSSQKVWWKCSKGHEWQAIIYSRTKGCGCPYCSGLYPIQGETDLLTTNPNIAKEWHYSKNGKLKPSDVSSNSNKKVWWKCSKGHEWLTSVSNRVKSNGCPYCSGRYVITGETDLSTLNPSLANEWNYEKNINLKDKLGRDVSTPDKVSVGSDIKAWWRCELGHEYQSSIANRIKGNGCPYCSGKRVLVGYNDLATLNPTIAKEWNYERNAKLTPKDVAVHSNKKIWWKCNKGHEWKTTISHRIEGTRCPYCYGGISKPVLCIETGIIYNSMTEAVNATGAEKANIVYCCKGKRKTAGGYHWKYVEDGKVITMENIIDTFQKKYPTRAEKEKALNNMTNNQIDELINASNNIQAKIFYSSFKK